MYLENSLVYLHSLVLKQNKIFVALKREPHLTSNIIETMIMTVQYCT